MEWGYLLDALQAERDQAVTIDAAHIRLRRPWALYLINSLDFRVHMVNISILADWVWHVSDMSTSPGLR